MLLVDDRAGTATYSNRRATVLFIVAPSLHCANFPMKAPVKRSVAVSSQDDVQSDAARAQLDNQLDKSPDQQQASEKHASSTEQEYSDAQEPSNKEQSSDQQQSSDQRESSDQRKTSDQQQFLSVNHESSNKQQSSNEPEDVDDKRVLVTGASGYLACHVIQQLQLFGYKVRGTVRNLQDDKKCQAIRELCPNAKHPVELVEADLLKAETWPTAVAGCTYIMHMASPYPDDKAKSDDDVIKPAVDGTLNIMRAIIGARCVKRIVMTSSIAAICDVKEQGKIYSESDWTDVTKPVTAYVKSKTHAERAAWNFVAVTYGDNKFELTVINPGFMVGPVLGAAAEGTSASMPKRLLERDIPMVPRVCVPAIDVRDVADAHVTAMTLPEAAGRRYILANGSWWFKDIAQTLDDEFQPQGYNVPTKEAPYFLMWIVAKFDSGIKQLIDSFGSQYFVDNTRMIQELRIKPRPVKEALIEMAYSLIDRELVKRTSKYKGLHTRKKTPSMNNRLLFRMGESMIE